MPPRTTPIRVLVADDSALMRNLISKLLSGAADLAVVATARDGEDAVLKARELKPDVVTMDINMPKLDGISAMQAIVNDRICPVIMLSSLTQQGATTTFECLELGAFDFVAKPDGTVSTHLESVAEDLVAKIRAAAERGLRRRPRPSGLLERRPATPLEAPAAEVPASEIHAIAIGISTGGPSTISTLLPYLPADLPAAVFLVQHMPPAFISSYAERLNKESHLRVEVATSGTVVQPGHCYVAGNALHLTLFQKTGGDIVIRTPGHPQSLFVPSVDVMMESVLRVYRDRTIGVLMTGIGDDGADQMVNIRAAGGVTIAESQESCVVFGMPYHAIKRGGAEYVLPSWEIADRIVEVLEARNAQFRGIAASSYARRRA